ncbi:uncharacterized protein Z518_09694 [Rhinocladiella mackenziei CBS 650.93]|uniref:Uncharacterized protein n=1 Tax=Rhinocladiella mackenziei CBS 650.93 TaxID=1442369 RepID=A0A0D2I4C8_9EURO|nr:uncharacterized protein Z518_09694 [Rhinocladiella mackenziei CBS 650.93]KIX00629.1 hypothetical protein Z518_09694 [Rhinocladiella mackenziei CBS 650.93]
MTGLSTSQVLTGSRPLQIRKDIRDVYDKDDTPVQKSFKKLAQILGYPVSCNVEWLFIWAELGSGYADRATFVPEVARVVETWADTLSQRLEDNRFESWTEEFLSKVEPVKAVNLVLEVSSFARPKTSWSTVDCAFTLWLPKKATYQAASVGSGFETDFENLFEDLKTSTCIEETRSSSRDYEGWSNIESTADSSLRACDVDPEVVEPDMLPALQTIPRPDVLFQTLTPYLMQVLSSGTNQVTVTATHEPSLKLLADYLQRWIKNDPEDVRKIPYLRIKLVVSNFGLGLFYDSLTIEPFDHHQRRIRVNVVLILAFIQGVLGYQPIHETSEGGFWEFRRTIPFKS